MLEDRCMYKYYYETPNGLSNMIMTSDGIYLKGLWFDKSKDEHKHVQDCEVKLLPIFEETIKWLDIYFSGKNPNFTPKYLIDNITSFRQEVIDCMVQIPYGETITYGDIAKKIATKKGLKRMSSQAVGGAVGWNPICIIIPCHRVVGQNNKLVGYGGGLENKLMLLKLEGNQFYHK